jgi:hypothetical protein
MYTRSNQERNPPGYPHPVNIYGVDDPATTQQPWQTHRPFHAPSRALTPTKPPSVGLAHSMAALITMKNLVPGCEVPSIGHAAGSRASLWGRGNALSTKPQRILVTRVRLGMAHDVYQGSSRFHRTKYRLSIFRAPKVVFFVLRVQNYF